MLYTGKSHVNNTRDAMFAKTGTRWLGISQECSSLVPKPNGNGN